MDTLNQAIRRTVAEAAARGGVIWVTDEAKRLEQDRLTLKRIRRLRDSWRIPRR
jgi:hypothetical protein